MTGRVCSARPLQVRRGYELSRLQQQLLSLAYEQLLPIIRPKHRAAPRPQRPQLVPAAIP